MAYYFKSSRFSSNGRTYESEVSITKDGREMINREEDSIRTRARMSASQVYRIELYVSGRGRSQYSIPNRAEAERIINTFQLEKCGSIYKGDEAFIYARLKETYPDFAWDTYHNRDGKGYRRLVYAVTYGDTPCTIIQTAKE